jgi:inner membrane transporter RhtA
MVAIGVVLGLMNPCFYVAIDHLPLATVAAIEFLPVVALAAAGVRSRRNALALVTAFAGVWLLSDAQIAGEPLGVALAFANAALFSLYIVLAHRVSRDPAVTGIDGLASAMLVAAALVTPVGLGDAATAFGSLTLLAAGIGVGVTSSVVPYVFDQLAMARMKRATYALMVSLLPATAAVIGVAVLAQIPGPAEAVGIGLVVGGVAIHRQSDSVS